MKDPVTGDELKPLEYFTRQVQVAVRTPWFLMLFNLTTIVIFLGHSDIWNVFASWLAVMIEWLVGTYMFGQTGRDAVLIRKIERMEEDHSKALEEINARLVDLQGASLIVAQTSARSQCTPHAAPVPLDVLDTQTQ